MNAYSVYLKNKHGPLKAIWQDKVPELSTMTTKTDNSFYRGNNTRLDTISVASTVIIFSYRYTLIYVYNYICIELECIV